jgi:hypothetical protein
MDERDTRELRIQQVQRELEERRRAEESGEPEETRSHERRADKHAYLREKLGDREESEREG